MNIDSTSSTLMNNLISRRNNSYIRHQQCISIYIYVALYY